MTITVKELKSHVTHFTEEIRQSANHMQEVKVGGEVKEIIPPLILLEEENPLSTFYIIKIDDLVGSMYVYVSQFVMNHYEEILKVGNTIVFDGFTKVLTRKTLNNFQREVSVVAYDVKELPSGELV